MAKQAVTNKIRKVGKQKKFRRTAENVEDTLAFKRLKYLRRPAHTLTDETILLTAAGVARGHKPATAASGAGISAIAYTESMKKGREDELRMQVIEESGEVFEDYQMSQQLKLVLAIKNALFVAEDTILTALTDAAAKGNISAAAWFLERRFPENYNKLTKIDQTVTTKNTETIIIVPETAESDEAWEKLRIETENKSLELQQEKPLKLLA